MKMKFDFEHCMEHDCKFCKKQIECERSESDSKGKEPKKVNHISRQRSRNAEELKQHL